MNRFLSNIKNRLRNSQSDYAQPGLFQYRRENIGESSKIHLRVDSDGSGLLIVNANRVMHLNPTAAFMARLFLENTSTETSIHLIKSRYRTTLDEVNSDYIQFKDQIEELIRPDGACPIHDLNLEINPPFHVKPTAPYRMDLALTYRCNNDCPHCYNARPRNFMELDSQEWRQIISKLWEIGIPHIVFTGGEPTLRGDLCELISHAEKIGQISGLNTNGRRLQDKAYVRDLVNAGLDHVQITLESHHAAIHDQMVASRGAWNQTVAGIKNALDSPLYVMTNTTLLQPNREDLADTINFLAKLGVPTVGMNALIYSGKGKSVHTGIDERELQPFLETARSLTQKNNQKLIWYTPTQYCNFDPVQMELGVKGCTAARYNMCIEPDGNVLPCQSYYKTLGNLLFDEWDSIWNHELAVTLRERTNLPDKCYQCALLSECGGGCPLYHQHLKNN